MQDSTAGYLNATRSSELPAIRGNRMQLFKRIIGAEPESEVHEVADFQLSTTQFVAASLLYQTNIYYTIHLIDILVGNGGLLVFISFLVVQVLVSTPLLMLFLFMSSYSKKGFLSFWDCVPMFAGLGYSMLLCRLTYAIFQIYFTTACFLLIIDFLRTPNMIENLLVCNYDVRNICQPMYPKAPLNLSCPNAFVRRLFNESVYIATQFHYRFDVIGYKRHTVTAAELQHTQVLITLLIWCLVLAVSIFGVQRIGKMTLNIQIILNCCSLFAVVYGLLFSDDPIVPRYFESNVFKIDFWVELLIHSTDIVVISDMIYLGTLKPKSLSPRQAGLLVGMSKMLFFIFIMFYTQRSSQAILGHYKFLDTRCLIIFGHDVLFAFIPDILYRVRFGVSNTLLWYIAIFYTDVNMLVYTIIGIVSAITEKFPKLYKYRIFVSVGICTIGFLGSLYFCTTLSMNTIYTFRRYGDMYYTTVCFITLNLALMFVYSTKRIIEDYTFTYGGPPKKFWVSAWQTTPIIALFTFIFMLYQFKETAEETYATVGSMMWSYIHCTIIIAPIFTQFLAKCFKHVKYRTLSTVTKPSDRWGPYDSVKRQSRKFFYPQRDVRYRNNVLNCQHRCIANSGKFYEENRKQAVKLHNLIHQAKERHIAVTGSTLVGQ